MVLLTIPEAAALAELCDGPKTLAEIRTSSDEFTPGLGLTLMHLEQAKLVVGYGLPRRYGMSTAGELAMKHWRRTVGNIVSKLWTY
jgi:hypothetical protein